jgi:LmbE family N-acetylglucosaminyl deacetylase
MSIAAAIARTIFMTEPAHLGSWQFRNCRAMVRLLGDSFDAVSQFIWRIGFGVAGRFARTEATIADPSDRRVLVVAPHPDDELAGCGGTLVRHLGSGARVTVMFVTDGRRSAALGLDPDTMAKERRREASLAAVILGISDVRWLGFPEGHWQCNSLRKHLESCFHEFHPELIYAPSCIDFHPEHRKVARALACVIPEDIMVRVYQAQVPLTSRLTNIVISVDEQMDLIGSACDAYRTQLGSLSGLRRVRQYAGSFHHAGEFAEEFWEISGADYSRIHWQSPEARQFRGIRPRAFSDGLAYWVGGAVRRHLKTLIRA